MISEVFTGCLSVTIILGILIGAFFICRSLTLWYFRINVIVDRLEEIAAAAAGEKYGEK